MDAVRPARAEDLARVAELEIFNYRLNFYPIFRYDPFYFNELQVPSRMEHYRPRLDTLWVYDDGTVKGFFQAEDRELKKLFVEPVLQGQGIGAALLEYAVDRCRVGTLWALEKNTRAIAFYRRHGFRVTHDRRPEEDTEEYLIRLERP
ncbi:MAG: GNAT family N-acetyltransferase [Clostridia bacterium]|nr:GNAT family N-acetyltransferase [Clostridia bacterium]